MRQTSSMHPHKTNFPSEWNKKKKEKQKLSAVHNNNLCCRTQQQHAANNDGIKYEFDLSSVQTKERKKLNRISLKMVCKA